MPERRALWKQAQSTSTASQPDAIEQRARLPSKHPPTESSSSSSRELYSCRSISPPAVTYYSETQGPLFTHTFTHPRSRDYASNQESSISSRQGQRVQHPHCCDGAEWPVARCPTSVTGPFILLVAVAAAIASLLSLACLLAPHRPSACDSASSSEPPARVNHHHLLLLLSLRLALLATWTETRPGRPRRRVTSPRTSPPPPSLPMQQ